MKIRPLHDRIIVKRLEAEEVARGGILIPDTAQEDGSHQPMDVKEGDTVLFGKYGGTDVKIGEEEYLILREEDVLGIVE